MKHWIRAAAGAVAVMVALTFTVAADSPLDTMQEISSDKPLQGMTVTEATAMVGETPQRLMTVTADPDDFAFAIGGYQSGKMLINDVTQAAGYDEATIAAAVNGDHFSFATGVPLGMSISNGELLANPVEPYNADDYYFHALGITADGEVLTGENPTLYMQFTVGDETIAFDRINRTREQWEGHQVVLYTPAYGESTGTDVMGTEIVVRVEEGEVKAGSDMKGVVTAVGGNDLPLEEGTVVISAHILRLADVEHIQEGDEVSFYFGFEDERWNDVTFAVGGNLTIVEEGESLPFDYTVAAFADPQPRTALGVQKDGTLVFATADGRSEQAGGMTANEMADYMAYELDCEYAILLDGGGSTAMAVADEQGVLQTVNTPSEERPVGNAVLLIQTASGGMGAIGYAMPLVAAVIMAALVGVIVWRRRCGKNDRQNVDGVGSEHGNKEN